MSGGAAKGRLVLAWLAPISVLVVVVALSSLPGSPRSLISVPIPDTVAHFLIYSVFGGLLLRALWLTDGRLARPATLGVSTLLAIGVGGLDEFYQGHVLYRTPEVGDLVADASGAFVGGLLVLAGFMFWRRRTTKTSK